MNSSEKRFPIDASNAVPLGLGTLALFGICLLLIGARLLAPRATIQPASTATSFSYLFIGTEPGISTALPSEDPLSTIETDEFGNPVSTPAVSATGTRRSGFAVTAASGFSSSSATQLALTGLSTDDPIIIFPGTRNPTSTPFPIQPSKSPTSTFTPRPTNTALTVTQVSKPTLVASTNTLPPANGNTPTRTPTSASVAPLNPGTYDDTDAHILYTGNWSAQNGVPEAYQGTLHVSTTLGNSITFRFIGQEMRLFYQGGPSLGIINITVDQQTFELNQSVEESTAPGSEWLSSFYPAGGTHTVVIQHASGGSVNIDQIIVPELIATVTP